MIQIFLADDDADDQMIFREAMKDVGYQTELNIVDDGEELMSALKEIVSVPFSPFVIFLDLNMPRKNGFECLKEIREKPKLKNIPVVIFSTSSDENAIESTYSLGANYFICKPNSVKLLKKAIENVLGLEPWKTNRQVQEKEDYVLSII